MPEHRTKHGMCGTRLYYIWRDMRRRCTCKGMKNYMNYGGRGIRVCHEWEDFSSFYKWAMASGYDDSLTIDRIDVNGNYEPGNCRWADKSVQTANRRNTGRTEYIGVYLHHNKSCYSAQIKKNRVVVFSYTSRSKNDCARKRNEYIIAHRMEYPLNEIKESLEDVRPHKNDLLYVAIDNKSNETIARPHLYELGEVVGLTPQFIYQCITGKRNSKKYTFERRVPNGNYRG